MFRLLFWLLGITVGALVALWYFSQSLPSWYQADNPQAISKLSEDIKQKGASQFLTNKVTEILSGQLNLDENEFNALLLLSLQSSSKGRHLLEISDQVHAQLNKNNIEVGAIINLDKLASASPKLKEKLHSLTMALPLLDQKRVYIGIKGQPQVKHGEITFDDDMTIKLGKFPLPNSVLEKLDISTDKITQNSLAIKYISVQSVELNDKKIHLTVLPKF